MQQESSCIVIHTAYFSNFPHVNKRQKSAASCVPSWQQKIEFMLRLGICCDRRDQRWFKSLRRPPALNWGDSENYCELSLTQATVGSLDQGDLE